MKLHRKSTVAQPRQKPMVKALAMALAVASGAASAIMPNANDAVTASGQQSQIAGKPGFLQDMSPSQRWSLYQNWRDSRRSPSEAGEIAALIDAWRHRHPAPTPSLQGKLKFSPGIEATHVVQNCNDSGAGSLRAAVAAAGNSDTIDLSQLACSTITLTTGAISVLQNDLNIIGPGADELAISGNNQSQVFGHTGSGTLSIDAVTLRDGFKYSNTGDVYGGCVFSVGSVSLSNVEVRDCVAVRLPTTAWPRVAEYSP